MFLLDTNFCVAYLRGRDAGVRARMLAEPLTSLHLCAPVMAELRFGAMSSSDPLTESEKVEAFLTHFDCLPFDDAATRQYSRIRLDLTRRGLPISEMDLLIASVALSRNLTLVTHNTAEFGRVPGLRIVDWEQP